MDAQRVAWAAVVVLAAGALAFCWHAEPDPRARGASGAGTATGRTSVAAGSMPSGAEHGATRASSPTSTDARAAVPMPTLAARIDALTRRAREGDAAAALEAYTLAAECAQIPFFQMMLNGMPADSKEAIESSAAALADTQARCASVTPRQLYDRAANLRIALNAGLREAVMRYYTDGPNGDWSDWQTRPDDPAVQQWKAEAVQRMTALAERGDRDALATLWIGYDEGAVLGRDAQKAYLYLYAFTELDRAAGRDRRQDRSRQTLLAGLEAQLTPAELDAARQQAQALVAGCCSAASAPRP